MSADQPQTTIVEGGGFRLWTSDPVVVAVVRRCAELDQRRSELERQNTELRHEMTARYRTLRRDVSQIKRRLLS